MRFLDRSLSHRATFQARSEGSDTSANPKKSIKSLCAQIHNTRMKISEALPCIQGSQAKFLGWRRELPHSCIQPFQLLIMDAHLREGENSWTMSSFLVYNYVAEIELTSFLVLKVWLGCQPLPSGEEAWQGICHATVLYTSVMPTSVMLEFSKHRDGQGVFLS